MTGSRCFETNDVNLVAYLAVRHMPHAAMVLDGSEVRWTYEHDEALTRELDEYRTGEAIVDPAEYGRQLARTRRGLFRFKEQQQHVA